MAHKINNQLATSQISSVYICSQDHVHVHHRNINISMTKEDFLDFAQTISQAMSEWKDLETESVNTIQMTSAITV